MNRFGISYNSELFGKFLTMDILGGNVNFSSFYILLHNIYKICLKYHLVSDMFGIS